MSRVLPLLESAPALVQTQIKHSNFSEAADFYRIDANTKLDPKKRAALGQYMTPAPIGRFMASLFDEISGGMRILDAGAGVGSLTASIIERLCNEAVKPRSVELTCYEIEPVLIGYLQNTLKEAAAQCAFSQIECATKICDADFILDNQSGMQPSIFETREQAGAGFTHAIMNPPYKKINSASGHRTALRKAGIETSNLYTGFMFLAAQRLQQGGEMVVIVPRSFCNGPYFKPFREQFFAMMALRHIHIFDKRNSAFKVDDVLQENIILHAVKGGERQAVKITTSRGGEFELHEDGGDCIAHDMTQRVVYYRSVIRPSDPDKFLHIAANDMEQGIIDRMASFTATLPDIGLEVSTGPVVDFRLKPDLRAQPERGAVPLLYAQHFQRGVLQWPKEMKKPNAIHVADDSRRWLWPNSGHYVVTRRFTSKEERRRIVASIYASELSGELVGFENHLNVFHADQRGVSQELATGLSIYLNSSLVDRYFRQFNGHTQVNATDLRSLRYPERKILERIGKDAEGIALSQHDIDNIIEGELQKMPDEINPLHAQQKIDEALQIVKALGMPKGQHNDRSALTLLALLDLKSDGNWSELDKPLMGITPIMDYTREHYGREYAPNSRETFRRQTMHQFVEAGIALYNPDQPDRPVNSPKACYQISEEAFQVILTFGTDQWAATLETYLEGQETLAAKWAKHRKMQMIPVTVAEGHEINLTAGAHSELIKQIITEFAPHFAPASEVIYVGDTGAKVGYFQDEKQNIPKSEDLRADLAVAEARACSEGPEREIFVRSGCADNVIYLDFADEEWRAVAVSSGGGKTADAPPVRFHRPPGMRALPVPRPGGSVDALRSFLNVRSDADSTLAVLWILAALRGRGPYPVLALSGEQGTAKSSFSSVIKFLIDPRAAPLRTLPAGDILVGQ